MKLLLPTTHDWSGHPTFLVLWPWIFPRCNFVPRFVSDNTETRVANTNRSPCATHATSDARKTFFSDALRPGSRRAPCIGARLVCARRVGPCPLTFRARPTRSLAPPLSFGWQKGTVASVSLFLACQLARSTRRHFRNLLRRAPIRVTKMTFRHSNRSSHFPSLHFKVKA